MFKTSFIIIAAVLGSLLVTHSANAGCTPCAPMVSCKHKCYRPTLNPSKKTTSILCHRNFSRTIIKCGKCKTTHYTEVTYKVVDGCGRTRIFKKALKTGSRELVKLGLN